MSKPISTGVSASHPSDVEMSVDVLHSENSELFLLTHPLNPPLGGAQLIFQAEDITAAFKGMSIDALTGKPSSFS
jgi:hypothetical protein